MGIVHAFDEIRRSEEHFPKALLDLFVGKQDSFTQHEDLEVHAQAFFVPAPSHDQVVVHQGHIDLPSERPVTTLNVQR